MIVFTGTSAHTDGAHHLSATLDRNATGKDHDLAVVRSVNAKKLLTRLRVLTQRLGIEIESTRGKSLFLSDVDAADPSSVHALERNQIGARIDHGDVHHDLDLVGLFAGRRNDLACFFQSNAKCFSHKHSPSWNMNNDAKFSPAIESRVYQGRKDLLFRLDLLWFRNQAGRTASMR